MISSSSETNHIHHRNLHLHHHNLLHLDQLDAQYNYQSNELGMNQ